MFRCIYLNIMLKRIVKSKLLFLVFLLAFSCNDDSSPFSESVLTSETGTEGPVSPLVNDYFIITPIDNGILHVLANDDFTNLNNIRVIEVSNSNYGSVEVNEDEKTVKYSLPILAVLNDGLVEELSNNQEKTTDAFTYTVEAINENGNAITATGTVTLDIINQGSVNPNATLLFSSGFEGNVAMATKDKILENRQHITGTDSETGFTWPPVLGGSSINALKLIHDGGNLHNDLRTLRNRMGANTKVMYNEKLANTSDITQSPFQLENWSFNPDKFYVRYWMNVNDSFIGKNKFRVIWETKTYNYDFGDGFRIVALMNTDDEGNESWEFRGDTKPGVDGLVWYTSNNEIPFPKDKWFLVEFFVDFEKTGEGQAFFKVNGQTIGNVKNVTNANSENIQVMMLTQIYGSVDYMYQYIDDIEIWDNVPY